MLYKARRDLSRSLQAGARRARLMVGVWLIGATSAVTVGAQDLTENRGSGRGCVSPDIPPHSAKVTSPNGPVTAAWFAGPTQAYQHGVLGDAIEADHLYVRHADGAFCDSVTAGPQRVFEDTSPRLIDLDHDGVNEVIVVASHAHQGARLEVYGYPKPGQDFGLLAYTPYIGRAHRWLAPIGAADLDKDGFVEIAYIDRPHLAKTLRIWRYKRGALTPVAELAGLTNHKIGQPYISGGIRQCGDTPEIVTVDARWRTILYTVLDNSGDLHTKRGARFSGPDSLKTALRCP